MNCMEFITRSVTISPQRPGNTRYFMDEAEIVTSKKIPCKDLQGHQSSDSNRRPSPRWRRWRTLFMQERRIKPVNWGPWGSLNGARKEPKESPTGACPVCRRPVFNVHRRSHTSIRAGARAPAHIMHHPSAAAAAAAVAAAVDRVTTDDLVY